MRHPRRPLHAAHVLLGLGLVLLVAELALGVVLVTWPTPTVADMPAQPLTDAGAQ